MKREKEEVNGKLCTEDRNEYTVHALASCATIYFCSYGKYGRHINHAIRQAGINHIEKKNIKKMKKFVKCSKNESTNNEIVSMPITTRSSQ